MSSFEGSPQVLGLGGRAMLKRFIDDADFRERVCNSPETEVGEFGLTGAELESLRAVHARLDGLADDHRLAFAQGRLAAAGGDDAGVLFW